jgi:hypothetical protein
MASFRSTVAPVSPPVLRFVRIDVVERHAGADCATTRRRADASRLTSIPLL